MENLYTVDTYNYTRIQNLPCLHDTRSNKGSKKAKIEFDVPADFALEDCRKCPLSYIGRNGDENVYECPLQMRGSCRLELS